MEKDKLKLLIIDDDPKVSWVLSEGLKENYQILSARNGKEGLQMVSESRPDLVLLDIKMPGMDGLEVLDKIKHKDKLLNVIMLSGHGETENVVESIKRGAAQFVTKPFDVKEVEIQIEKVLEKNKLEEKIQHLESELKSRTVSQDLVGDSFKIQEVKSLIEQVADSELTVLIRGESGTGKEIAARMLHSFSSRRNEPFIKVNCAALPRDLLEAELFGYEKGAFTGAHKTKPGRFEIANKGTIFLDEIGDLPLELQSKLLQVLEQHEFMRVGGVKTIKVDVRIVCATNRDLEKALKEKNLRDDLYYRLNEISINLPPLREKKEDIPLLIEHFLKRYNNLYNKNFNKLSTNALRILERNDWPGNVRQLENLIKQIVVRENENMIYEILKEQPSFTPEVEVKEQTPSPSVEETYSLKKRVGEAIASEERRLIAQVLNKTNWNRRKAAEILKISYRSLLYKIKEYALDQ
ncbi:MAG: sigma-54 dependent transcriptional regulator [Candidatus Zixiibacteriota bacterium]